MPWKTIDGEKEVGNVPMLEVLLRGACTPERLLDMVQKRRQEGQRQDAKQRQFHCFLSFHRSCSGPGPGFRRYCSMKGSKPQPREAAASADKGLFF